MYHARSTSATRALAIRIALALTGSLLLAISAKVAVPMLPVPITLQTLALPLLVLALGRNLAVIAAVLYLIEGFTGLPVFAPGSLASAGYLFMYPIAAFIMGTLLDRGLAATMAGRWAAMFAGELIIFAGGAGWLIAFLHLDLATGIALGVTPFIIGDLLKITIASALPSQAARLAAALRV